MENQKVFRRLSDKAQKRKPDPIHKAQKRKPDPIQPRGQAPLYPPKKTKRVKI